MRIFLAGAALVAAGVAVFAVTFSRLYNGASLEPQTLVPGAVEAQVDAPGRYYLWDNHWTMFEGKRFQYPDHWPETATVTARDGDDSVLEFVPDASQNWSIGNTEKTSIGYVEVPAPTTLRLQVDDLDRERVVTVSDRTMQEELWAKLSGFGIGLALALVGAPIAGLGLLLGRRAALNTARGEQAAPAAH